MEIIYKNFKIVHHISPLRKDKGSKGQVITYNSLGNQIHRAKISTKSGIDGAVERTKKYIDSIVNKE